MAKYTYEDIIMDPNDPRLENAIGKECYFADYPKKLLNSAIYDLPEYLDCLTDIKKEGVCTFVDKKGTKWASIIIKKEEPYAERAKKWIEQNDLKEGDYVKVLRKAKDFESGWDATWNDLMNKSVCKILKITEVRFCNGHIILEDGYRYPYFVLEKSEPPKPKYVPFESIEEFVRRYTEVKEGVDYDTFEDRLFRCGMWLRYKEDGDLILVTGLCDDAIYVRDFTFGATWKEVLNKFEFLDGAPCGKEAKDE